jgi:KDO2-lipid IV(A) lauroyltransferase
MARVLESLAYAFFWLFSRLVRALPLERALALGAGVGRLILFGVGRRRRLVLENLRLSFPEKTESERRAIARRSVENLGRTLVEVLRLPDFTEEDARHRIRVEGLDTAAWLRKNGKGALALSAHFGNFEYIAVGLNRLGIFRCHLIGRPIRNRGIDRAIRSCRAAHGVETIPNRRSVPAILDKLRRGEGIGVVLDQNMKRSMGIFVDFFGRPASTTPGLAVLAHRSGAPVVPVFAVRESAWRPGGDPANHVISIGRPIPWEARGDLQEALRVNTQAYTRVIEDWVRRFPDQWFWLHDRWRTKPREKGRPEDDRGQEGPLPLPEAVGEKAAP